MAAAGAGLAQRKEAGGAQRGRNQSNVDGFDMGKGGTLLVFDGGKGAGERMRWHKYQNCYQNTKEDCKGRESSPCMFGTLKEIFLSAALNRGTVTLEAFHVCVCVPSDFFFFEESRVKCGKEGESITPTNNRPY